MSIIEMPLNQNKSNSLKKLKMSSTQGSQEVNPKVVLVLSGKRKSGKDYVAALLEKRLKGTVTLRIGAPIKRQYAKDHGLDYDQFLDSTEYKEQYRRGAVVWSESVREKDPDIFLRLAIEQTNAIEKPVWILADARRPTDVRFFRSDRFKDVDVHMIRITASDETRKSRGWVFTPDIDDKTTECGLDEYDHWDHIIANDNLNEEQLLEKLRPIIEAADAAA